MSFNRLKWMHQPKRSIPSERYLPRARFLFSGGCVLFLAFAIRLYDLQVLRHDHALEQALKQQIRTEEIVAPRGEIRDRNGRLLATSISTDWLVADVGAVAPKAPLIATELSTLLGRPKEQLLRQLTVKKDFVPLEKDLSPALQRGVEALRARGKLHGIEITKTLERVYPYHPVASQYLGFVQMEALPFHEGLGRIREGGGREMFEQSFDPVLRSTPGNYQVRLDKNRHPLETTIRMEAPPRSGQTLWLTLDIDLQGTVECELERTLRENKAVAGTVLVMDPRTGEILAASSKPDGGDRKTNNWTNEERRNRVFTDIFEPGSAMKPFVFGTALAEQAIRVEDTFPCGADYAVRDRTFRDWKTFNRRLSVTEILANSSNIGTIQIAERLASRIGQRGYREALHRYGFGEKTGVAVPAESSGLLPLPENFSGVSVASLAIGYEIGVTPIQLLAAFSAIFNEGLLMKPLLVAKVTDAAGREREKFAPQPVRQVLPAATAAELRKLLQAVVEQGTGKGAAVEGCVVAGKTGTTRRDYAGKKTGFGYVSSFVGNLACGEQVLAMLVVIFDPRHGEYYGSHVAAPLFQRIGARVAGKYRGETCSEESRIRG